MTVPQTIEEMATLLEAENTALTERRLSDVAAALPAKIDCAKRLGAHTSNSTVSTDEHRHAIERLQSATERNERLLRIAIAAQEQVIEMVKRASRDALPSLYNRNGCEATITNSHDTGNVIMRL